MSAADVYQSLGIAPLNDAGRSWLLMNRPTRAKALQRNGLSGFYRAYGWRDLPPGVADVLEQAYASRQSG